MSENENGGVSRRGFIGGTIAAAAGVGVLPLLPGLASEGHMKDWLVDAAEHVLALREAYGHRIAALAAELESRFRSGELHANRESEEPENEPWSEWPQGRMEAIATAAFGLTVTQEKGYEPEGDAAMGFAVLACSPHGATVSLEYNHICHDAAEAVAWDLLAEARRAGYYTPTDDETEDPLIGLEGCPECGHYVEHHDEAGCRSGEDCPCTKRHARHVPGMLT